ncbi:MAG: phosphatase PAP2 family protein [Saccharofermentans sp.]|nr:phosphatase PAP2 family protein [Saccharofermentans sp.]
MDWDAGILLYIQEYIRTDLLDPFMIFITHTVDNGIFWIALSIILFIIPKTRRTGFLAATSLIIEAVITNLLLKNVVARTRPYEVIDGLVNLIEKQKDYSFPSGHSGASFAVAGAIFVVALLGLPVIEKTGELTRAKTHIAFKIFAVLMLLYAVLVAFSRLYVGVHYPTDVLGGILLGIASSFLVYFIYHFVMKKIARRKAEPKEQAV